MTTTTRPSTSTEHANEARRLLGLVRRGVLTDEEREETYVYEDAFGIFAAAQVHATLALVEEQRTANLIAADTTDQLGNPYPVGTREHDAYWKAHTDALADRLAVQR